MGEKKGKINISDTLWGHITKVVFIGKLNMIVIIKMENKKFKQITYRALWNPLVGMSRKGMEIVGGVVLGLLPI